MFFYYNNDGLVKMFSETEIHNIGNLNRVELQVTEEERSKLSGYTIKYVLDKGLTFEYINNEKRKEEIIQEISDAKNMDDLKKIILKLI